MLGASGFVGKDLVGQLKADGIDTLALSSRDVDLTQKESKDTLVRIVKPEDALVFVSALTPDRGRDVATFMRNLMMGENVAGFLEVSPCSQVIYISSDAVYEDDANPVRETSCCAPSGFHGLMHLVRERMLAHALGSSETPFLILRPSLLYGSGDTHNGYGPNRFLRSAREEAKISLFGNGEEKRDHVYVKDLSRLIGQCLDHQSCGVLNVATGDSVPFMEVAQAVAQLSDGDVEIETRPRATPITHRHFDIAQAIKGLPSFRFVSLETGLRESFE